MALSQCLVAACTPLEARAGVAAQLEEEWRVPGERAAEYSAKIEAALTMTEAEAVALRRRARRTRRSRREVGAGEDAGEGRRQRGGAAEVEAEAESVCGRRCGRPRSDSRTCPRWWWWWWRRQRRRRQAAGGRRLAARHQRQKRQEAGSGAGNDGSGGGARWGKCESYPYILHTPWFLKIIYRKHTHPGSGVRFCAR